MNKIKYLRWWDILIITVIMIGMGIYSSNIIYFSNLQNLGVKEANSVNTVFTLWDNLQGFFKQFIQLIAALLYLKWRNFDFSQWKFKINWKNTVFGIFLFIICGLAMDIWFIVCNYLAYIPEWLMMDARPLLEGKGSIFSAFNMSSILYALLNGPYEEIFFLGICLSVKPEYRKQAFWYTLFIRLSFHTYQGMINALGIGVILTVVYYHFYMRKNDNLYPYFLSHTIADIFGLGIILRIIYWLN